MHTYIHTPTFARELKDYTLHTYIHTYIHTYTYIHIHTPLYIRTYTYIHTMHAYLCTGCLKQDSQTESHNMCTHTHTHTNTGTSIMHHLRSRKPDSDSERPRITVPDSSRPGSATNNQRAVKNSTEEQKQKIRHRLRLRPRHLTAKGCSRQVARRQRRGRTCT